MTITSNLMGTGLSGIAAQQITGIVADALTATGTTQATAFLLSSDLSVFATVASGTGCRLRDGGENDQYTIVNDGANALLIYPPLGGTINGGAVNASISLAAGSATQITYQSSLALRVLNNVSSLSETGGAARIGFTPQGEDGVLTNLDAAIDRLIKPRVDGTVSRKIVFAGSSVAAGNNATNNNGWAQQVGTALTARGWTVVNSSVGGNTTQLLLDRFHADVIVSQAPDICVIALSLNNEGIQNQGTAAGKEIIFTQFIENIKKLIWICRQNSVIPVIAGVYPNDGFGADDYKFLRSMNRFFDSQSVATFNWLDTLENGSGGWISSLQSDGTHPNDSGHSAMYYCVPISFFEGLLDWNDRKQTSYRGSGWKTTGTPGNIPIKAFFDTPMRSYSVGFRIGTAEANKGIWGVNNSVTGNPTRIKTSGGVYIFDTGAATITSTVVVDGREHHFMVVYNHWNSLIYFYIDGVSIGSTAFQQSETVQWMAFMDRASGTVPVVGSIRDVQIYRTALSAATVKTICDGDVPKGSLELWCPLGDPETALYSRASNMAQTASYLAIQSAGVEVSATGEGSKLQNIYYVTTSTADPTTSDINAGTWGIWKNSTGGTLKLWSNDLGVMKSVALT